MSKRSKIVLSLVLFFSALTIVARITGMIAFYTSSSSNMAPTYPVGYYIIASNLWEAQLGDAVCYEGYSVEIPGIRPAEEAVYIGRIVGQGGDKLEIKNGYVYLNDQYQDDSLSLKFMYRVTQKVADQNIELVHQMNPEDKMPILDEMLLFLSIEEKAQFTGHKTFTKMDLPLNNWREYPAKEFVNASWTNSNYGPIQIPKDHYFIMGDNRDNSEDSRVKGFIPKKDIKAVVLN